MSSDNEFIVLGGIETLGQFVAISKVEKYDTNGTNTTLPSLPTARYWKGDVYC